MKCTQLNFTHSGENSESYSHFNTKGLIGVTLKVKCCSLSGSLGGINWLSIYLPDQISSQNIIKMLQFFPSFVPLRMEQKIITSVSLLHCWLNTVN